MSSDKIGSPKLALFLGHEIALWSLQKVSQMNELVIIRTDERDI